MDPCAVTLECGQMEGAPVTWTVDVEPKTVFSYKSGAEADLEAALVAAGKTEAEARRRTTCEVFSPDPLEARAYTRIAGELIPVADQSILLDQAAPQRIATLIDLSPPQSWVHLYCRKDRPAPDAAPADTCAVNLECRQEEGDPVSWTVCGRCPEDHLFVLAGQNGLGRDVRQLASSPDSHGQNGRRSPAPDHARSVQPRPGSRSGLYPARRGHHPGEELSGPSYGRSHNLRIHSSFLLSSRGRALRKQESSGDHHRAIPTRARAFIFPLSLALSLQGRGARNPTRKRFQTDALPKILMANVE